MTLSDSKSFVKSTSTKLVVDIKVKCNYLHL